MGRQEAGMNEQTRIDSERLEIKPARHFQTFIEDQVASGQFGNATQVVEEGLRLLERRESKLGALRQALIEGEESGEPIAFDMEEWLAEQHRLEGLSPPEPR
jgi:antitoxin ParD1/3/4